MIDIETLGTKPGSIILEIAAAIFDPYTNLPPVATHHHHINILDSLANGFTADPDTAKWHLAQQTNLYDSTIYPVTVWNALCSLSTFISIHNPTTIWAWGMDFERPILAHAYQALHITFPWQYWLSADARTIWKTVFPNQKPAPRKHNALADVLAQLADLRTALNPPFTNN